MADNFYIEMLGSRRPYDVFRRMERTMQREITKRSIDNIIDVLREGANKIRNKIIKDMRSSPPDISKVYKRGKKKHNPSRPGRPPRVDTGDLIGSIGIDDRLLGLGAPEIEIGSNLTEIPYPIFLEKGTERMDARPWLAPAVNLNKNVIEFRVGMALKKAASEAMERGF